MGASTFAVLEPDVVLRVDAGALTGASRLVRGAQAVAAQAATFVEIDILANPERLSRLDLSALDS